jgi:hypothetical protein
MAQAANDLLAAWRAIMESGEEQPGWRSIPLGPGGQLRAGVLFPERNEALIAGFGTKRKLLQTELPAGRGFLVQQIQSPGLDNNHSWFSLSRRDGADSELFLTMTCSVLDSLGGNESSASEDALQIVFMQRIRAWQRFMQRSAGLDRESETGLHGELVVLDHLLDDGCAPMDAVAAWEGPLEALHDFILGSVAIEVKTTTARSGFPVTVGSLEQLDTPSDHRLVLAGIRLCEQQDGHTLPERVARMRMRLAPAASAAQAFETRLLSAGYLHTDAEQFSRRLSFVERRNLQVTETFPRLARSLVSPAIREARYKLDLDMVNAPRLDQDELKAALGLKS